MKKFILAVLLLAVIVYMSGKKKPEIKNVGNTGANVVVFGDSLSYGYGAPRGQSYPDLIARKISRLVINLGRNGETAVRAARRVEEVLEQNPYMVLIEFGGNDFMRGVDFQQTVQAVSDMVDQVQTAGAVAVVVDTGGYYGMKKYSKAYQKLAKEKGAVFVKGILDGVFGKTALMSDQIHPNAKGYEIVADKVYQGIKDYL